MMPWELFVGNLRYLLIGAFPDGPLGGAALTLVLAVASAIASGLLGFAAGIALAMAGRAARVPLLVVIGFFRAIPVLMLIFWTYFLLPILFHVDVPGLAAVVCALSLIGGAYLAHSVHAGIVAVGDAQWQAGLSLGLTRWQTLREVVLLRRRCGSWRRPSSTSGSRWRRTPRWPISSASTSCPSSPPRSTTG